MAVEKFRVESSHIMMFARSIGDPNPIFDCTVTDPKDMVAPPTFAQSSAQFDPDYFLRPKVGADGWFGSGKEPSGMKRTGGGGGGGGGGGPVLTVIVPVMNEWIVQWYGYTPALLNVKENVSPLAMLPESHTAVSDVVVCVI